MSRVEDQQKAAQADAERVQKEADRAARDAKRDGESRARFGDMMKQGQTRAQQASSQAQKQMSQQAAQQHGQASQDSARMARMARGGTLQHGRILEQVKSFQSTLQTQRAETEQGQKGQVERREEGIGRARVQTDERSHDIEQTREQRAELDKEQQRAEAQAEGKANAAINGQARRQGSSSGGGEGRGDGQPSAIGKTGASGPAETEGAREVKGIPEAILEALANEVYVGVTAEGLAEFRVELKEGVLEGATLRVIADGKSIKLAFDGLKGNAKRLVQACEGDIAKRLSAKGLHLDELTT